MYKGLNIGTAKPTLDERAGVPHYMIDVVEPTESFSVSDYEEMALPIVERLLKEGKTPIICGGTGFYINSLLYKSQFGNVGANEELRAEYERLAEEKGKEYVYSILCEKDAESALLATPTDLSADVLKVSHHGSATGTSTEFLTRVNPQIALITCGADNKYGHPHEEVLQRLQTADITTYRSDVNGIISLRCDGKTITVTPERGEAA